MDRTSDGSATCLSVHTCVCPSVHHPPTIHTSVHPPTSLPEAGRLAGVALSAAMSRAERGWPSQGQSGVWNVIVHHARSGRQAWVPRAGSNAEGRARVVGGVTRGSVWERLTPLPEGDQVPQAPPLQAPLIHPLSRPSPSCLFSLSEASPGHPGLQGPHRSGDGGPGAQPQFPGFTHTHTHW